MRLDSLLVTMLIELIFESVIDVMAMDVEAEHGVDQEEFW